jgi:hypothetical protein
LREDAQKLKKEKTNLEGMIQSHDELIMEMAKVYGLNRMGENDDDENDDDEGNAATPPAPAPPAAMPERIIEDEGPMEMIPEQEAPVLHEVILADAEPEMPQARLYRTLKRDYEESPLKMMDDLDDLDDDPNEGRSDMDEWFHEDGSNDRD